MNEIRIYTLTALFLLTVIASGTYAHTQVDGAVHTQTHVACTIATAPQIVAHAAYAYDVSNKEVLFAKNSNAQLPLASLTKIMTALVAAEKLPRGEVVSISEQALTTEGNSGLFAQELWEVKDLIDFTLMTSSNDGARALALSASKQDITAFINEMNAEAAEAGLTQTYFLNETGLDVSTSTAGAYGSARDIAQLLMHALRNDPDALYGSAQQASVYTSLSGFLHNATHTSDIPRLMSGDIIVKTGFTDLAGGNLAVLTELLPGKPVALVVLGSTRETREDDILALANVAKEKLHRRALCK